MRKIIGIVVILLMASGYAAAAEYWHFGAGVRLTGVVPGKDYSNALGMGALLTFGDPDSRFTTQMDFDTWNAKFTRDGEIVLVSTLQQLSQDPPDSVWKMAEHKYSGIGFGVYEKYRALDISSTFSTYIIGGFGAYFLDFQREERTDYATVEFRSYGLHSLFQLAGGLGLDAAFSQHVACFIEGRFVGILNGEKDDPSLNIKREDASLMKGFLGIRYTF
jgi:opacity protein-like surface antigen